ncbi:MAG TPA: ABC transporter permease [Gemmatimonadaceae bacterium]|nr:ABC transporter permease [Gemmatimonadaceae bacterium]
MSRSRRIARDAALSLSANRGRTGLMVLGLAAAVAVLSAVIVAGQGARAEMMALVSKHGLDMLMVRAGGEVQVFAPRADRGLSVLFPEDAEAIEREVPGVRLVSPVQNQRGMSVVYEDRSVITRAFGVNDVWMTIRRWGMSDGDFVSAEDMGAMSRVVMLGARVARELFPAGDAVGKVVRVNNDPYTVKGVFIEMGASAGGDDWDDRIVVPFSTSSRRLFNRPSLEQIVIRVADARRLPETAERVRSLLRVRHQIGAGEPDDFFVREPEDVEGAAVAATSTATTLLVVLSVIALAAAGVVIAALMLASVRQRTQEIGLRRATGARASDIRRQFLLESLFVALIGGVIGVAVGVVAALAISATGLSEARVTWLPFLAALLVCAAIGLAAGVIPARAAAAVQAATSLRERTA